MRLLATYDKLYSTKVCGETKKKNTKKKKHNPPQKSPCYAISMSAQPANLQPAEDVRAPRKRQVPLNANGEPVTIGPAPKRKKSAPEQTG